MTFSEWSNKKKKKEEEEAARTSTTKNTSTQKTTGKKPSFSEWSNQKYGIEVEDIAPVKTTTTMQDEEDRKWFQKGAFEDGYQFGDVFKTILGTDSDIIQNIGQGARKMAENAVDAGLTGVGFVAEKFGADEFAGKVKDVVAKDHATENPELFAPIARTLLNTSVTKPIGVAIKGISGLNSVLNGEKDSSVLGDKSDALVQSATQFAIQSGLSMSGVPWYLTAGATSFGSEAESAFNEGATYNEAVLSGVISAGSEILTEKLFGGSGLGEKGLINLEPLTKGITNKVVKAIADYGVDLMAEGTEEVVSQVVSNLGSALYKEESLYDILLSEEALDGYIESFVGGALISGGANVGKVSSSIKTGRDYRTGLSANEQKVFDKEYKDRLAEEEKNGKLTQKQKDAIYDKVVHDMERGYISTDTIEEVLGGETYKTYKDTVDNEDALRKEYEELGKKKDSTLAEQTRYRELHEQMKALDSTKRNELKTRLGSEVMSLVKGDRLAESYNERARRGQAFEADVSKYDAKQQATIQKAIDSGILNNTNRTHEFVDMIAKITADKGVSFDFTNNEKLKNSGFAVEGKAVNGYVTKDGITLNIDSTKSLNSVVGHEITHVLEGTELYKALESAVTEYAKNKGEYDKRLANLTELYKNVEDADVNAELVADLVGDYLFTDADFINNLSTINRNVFQKIYDEIKYLCKVATAGSKEARDLERVKKAFEDAYRASSKTQADTKHSPTDAQPEFTTESEVQFSLSNDTAYMDKAIEANNASMTVDSKIMEDTKALRAKIAARMNEIKDRGLVALPEDVEGNTYIANSSYDGTEENTTICPRSLASEAFVDAVSEYLGRPLTVEEQIYISQDLQGRTLTPECLYCYVATDRKAYRAFLGEWVKQRDAVIEKLKANPDADLSRNGALYTEFRNGRKDTTQMYDRFKMWTDAYKNGKPMVDASHLANINKLMGDINSEFGAELKPQIVDAMKYAQSASWAKKRINYVAYNGHILNWKQSRIDKLNSHYGLRMYSFSDFHPAFVLENMQMITDASVRGLKMLGYTKDTDFVEIFAHTGMNINVSTFGFESGGQVFENNIIGANWDSAKALREQYPNVGVTFVATNDTLVDWALAQDWIDVVIPYHLVRTGAEVAKALNYTNYTSESSDTKTADWKKGDAKYIAPTEHNNDKATYLAALEKNHLKPRFERFLNNPNYMKLVNECRRPASESKPVQPTFNEDAAMKALAKLEANGYYQPIGGSVDRMYEIAAEVAETMTQELAPSMSLSGAGEQFEPVSSFDVFGSDIALDAPVREGTVSKMETVAKNATVDIAPVKGAEKEPQAQTVKERIAQKIANFQTELENNARLRDQSRADFDAEIARLQEVYDGLANKNTMKANDLLRRIERRQRMKGNVDADYANRIANLEQRIEKMSTQEYQTAEQRQEKQHQYETLMENLVGDTSTWVDKKFGLGYKVNTLKRNLRDVIRKADGSRDIQKADAIYDELQGKYNHNEARLKTESNRIKKPYADLKITKAEDAYIQMLGELRYNPDTTLSEAVVTEFYEKHKGSIDTAKVDKVIADARKTYDGLLIRVNEVLKEQGMKEIPYRKGYFPHFTEDKQNFLAKLFNWKTHNNDIPTDIAGLTENFNPNRSWQSFNKQRESDTTDYSFMKGMDTYVQGALDWIYHIEDIQKRRALENYIRYIHSEQGVKDRIDAIKKSEEYDADQMQDQIDLVYAEARNPLNNFVTNLRAGTNTLANKKSSMDRGMEEDTNRKFYSTMTNISNRVSANMVAGSVSSALTNFIPITQSWGEVSPVSSLRAMGDTIRSTFRDDGMVNKSDFLTNRLNQSENLYKSGWDKVSEKVGILMEAVDSFTSQTVWRSKYIENMSKGMSENEAIKNADEFAEGVMAGRSRGNMPTIFDSKNPLIKTLTAFQLEVANQYGYMFKDMPQDMRNNSVGKLAMGYAKMFLGAYAYNALYSKLTGRDAAFDPIGIIEDLLRDLGWIGDEEEEEPVDAILNLTDNILEETPFVGGLLGGGRVPISSALPYDGIYEAFTGTMQDVANKDYRNLTKEWLNPVYYLAMPMGGGQIRKTVQGLSMFSDDHPIAGSYTDSGNLRFPVEDTVGNRIKAGIFGQWASKNAREYFDEGRNPLNEKQTKEFSALGVTIQDYWDYQDAKSKLSERAESEDATDDEILASKYLNSVNSELSDILKEQREVMENPDLTDEQKQKLYDDAQKRFDELSRECYESYGTVTFDNAYREGGRYARVGDRVYKLNDKGEWTKLSDEQVTKYEVTKAAGNAPYADDGKNYYRWHKPEGKAAYWDKMTEDQVTKYLATRNANGHYATNGTVHYRLEEGGDPKNISDWTKISDKELARQNEVTSKLGITPEEYWSKTEKTVFPMYSGEYEYAYENPENYAVAKAVGGYDAYRGYSNDLSNIKADKDANGKSVSGSRKKKVLEYINNLDADYYTKIVLWKSEYPSDDSYNTEIIEYLNGRDDISYDDMVNILTELGFKVSEDGTISW